MDRDYTPTPIHALDPSSAPEPTATVRAVVTLTWPYSSSSHSSALLLADPDFRLRSRRGQVRVRFTGACADALATVGLQIGDSVLLGLNGARWGEIGDGVVRTPGKSVEAELVFSRTLRLRTLGKAGGPKEEWNDVKVDGDNEVRQEKGNEGRLMNALAARPSTNGYAAALDTTPAPKRKSVYDSLMQVETDEMVYKSPAFGKRLRLSGDEAWLDSMYDPFNDNTYAEDLERPAKRQKVSFEGVRWRLAKTSPSPPPAVHESKPSRGATDGSEVSRRQANGFDVSNEDSQPIISEHREGDVQNLGVPSENDAPSSPPSLYTTGLLRTDMLPPPLPGPRASYSDRNDVSATNVLSEDAPLTPRLNPVDTSTLPLPSPFPVEGTQFPFSTSSTTFDNPINPQLSVTTSMLSTANRSSQEPAPTGQGTISAQASQRGLAGGNDPRVSAGTDSDPLVDDMSSEGSKEIESDEEYDKEGNVHMDQLHESDVEEVIEVSDGDEPPDSESDSADEDVREDGDADSRRHSTVSHAPSAVVQHSSPSEMRTSVNETGERSIDMISTPDKDVPLNIATSFRPGGTSFASSSEHVTPQSGQQKVMARTLSSLFGFKGSADETDAPDSEKAALMETANPTHRVVASEDKSARNYDPADMDSAGLAKAYTQSPDIALRTPTAVESAQPKDIPEENSKVHPHVDSGAAHAMSEGYEALHRPSEQVPELSEAASQIQGAGSKSERDPSSGSLPSHMYREGSGPTIDDQINARFIDDTYSGDGMSPYNTQAQGSNDALSLSQYDGAVADIPGSADISEEHSMLIASKGTAAGFGEYIGQEFSEPTGDGNGIEEARDDAFETTNERSQSEIAPPLSAESAMPALGAEVAIETIHADAAPDSYFDIEEIINDAQLPDLDDSADLEHMLPLEEATVPNAEPSRIHESDHIPAMDERWPEPSKMPFQNAEVIDLGSSSSQDPDDTINNGNIETDEIVEKTDIVAAEESLHADFQARDGMRMLGEPQLHSASDLDPDATGPSHTSQDSVQHHQRSTQSSLFAVRPLSPLATQSSSHALEQTDAGSDSQETESRPQMIPPTPRLTQHTSSPRFEKEAASAKPQTMQVSEPAFFSQAEHQESTFGFPLRAARLNDNERGIETGLSLTTDDHQETNGLDVGGEGDGQLASSASVGAQQRGDTLEARRSEVETDESQQQIEDELHTSHQVLGAQHVEEAEHKELPPSTQKKASLRKAKNSRLSFVPDVVKEWFSPRRSSRLAKAETSGEHDPQTIDHIKTVTAPVDEGMTLRNGHRVGQDSSHDKPATTGFSTPLAYFAPLHSLSVLVNSSSQQTANRTVDVFAVVSDATKEPQRAKGGPKDFFTIFRIADQSLGAESSVRVEVFRPWMATLPMAQAGDVILLRGFLVKSRRRLPYLISTESSAWCVWRYEEHGNAAESDTKKPAWARRRGAINTGTVREEIKGPPVEFGKEEKQHAASLRNWWLSLTMSAKTEEKDE